MAKRINVGDRLRGIPAADWNEFADVADKVRRLQVPPAPTGAVSGTPYLSVEVTNKTGADLSARFPVLKLSEPTVTTVISNPSPPPATLDNPDIVDEPICFNGETPDSGEVSGIVILQGPTRDDDSIAAVLVGHCWVDVNITDAGHTHAVPISADNTKLASSASGIEIFWKPSGTGVKRCVVVLGVGESGGGKRTTIVRATAAIPAGSGDPRSPGLSDDYEHIKGDTISGDIENWSTVEISDNSYMVILEIDGDNVIVSAFC